MLGKIIKLARLANELCETIDQISLEMFKKNIRYEETRETLLIYKMNISSHIFDIISSVKDIENNNSTGD